MIKHSYIFIMICMLLGSCGLTTDKESESTQNTAVKIERPDNCDDFLEEYGAWANNYIEVLRMFRRRPSNAEMAKKYNTVSRELNLWTTDWNEFSECSDDNEYQKQYNKIQQRIKVEQKRLEGN